MFKNFVKWIAGFIKKDLMEEIDGLDAWEPTLVILIKENLKPEDVAKSVVA